MSTKYLFAALSAKVGNPFTKLVLIKLADNANDDGQCWPSYKYLAEHCEISRRTVIMHIQALEKLGMLTIERRKSAPKVNHSNHFTLLICGESAALGGEAGASGGGESPAPRTYQSKPINETKERKRSKSLADYIADCKAEDKPTMPPDAPVFSYAEKAAIPEEFISLAWSEFREYYLQHPAKRQISWPLHFANAVRRNWYSLWFFDESGVCQLTSKGRQAKSFKDNLGG